MNTGMSLTRNKAPIQRFQTFSFWVKR